MKKEIKINVCECKHEDRDHYVGTKTKKYSLCCKPKCKCLKFKKI